MNQETKEQSALLTQFYRAYAGWLDAGAPDELPFCRSGGLCWMLWHYLSCQAIPHNERKQLTNELEDQFEAAGLNYLFPFNDGEEGFSNEEETDTMHLNPRRIKWVRDHAQM